MLRVRSKRDREHAMHTTIKVVDGLILRLRCSVVQPIAGFWHDLLAALRSPWRVILKPLREKRLERYRDLGRAKLRVSFNNDFLDLLIQNLVSVPTEM